MAESTHDTARSDTTQEKQRRSEDKRKGEITDQPYDPHCSANRAIGSRIGERTRNHIGNVDLRPITQLKRQCTVNRMTVNRHDAVSHDVCVVVESRNIDANDRIVGRIASDAWQVDAFAFTRKQPDEAEGGFDVLVEVENDLWW